MTPLRDVLALLGCAGIGFVAWHLGQHSRGATSQGLCMAIILASCVVWTIAQEARKRIELRSEIEKQRTRILYLEAALKQSSE